MVKVVVVVKAQVEVEDVVVVAQVEVEGGDDGEVPRRVQRKLQSLLTKPSAGVVGGVEREENSVRLTRKVVKAHTRFTRAG